MSAEGPTARELSLRGQQYRNYTPDEFREALENEMAPGGEEAEEGRKAVKAALGTVESGRFNPFLEAVSTFFFKLDADERGLFTKRNPGIVRWMSVWNRITERNPYERWDELAASRLSEPITINLKGQSPTEGIVSDPGTATPYERPERTRDTLLEDMAFRRRSYRNWAPSEFFDIADETHELGRGMVRELGLLPAETFDELTDEDFPQEWRGKRVARALMDRVEDGRFDAMMSEARTFFMPLDPDERKLFALRNPGLLTWMAPWAFIEDLGGRQGESLFSLTDVELPLIQERGRRRGMIGAPRQFTTDELLDDLRDMADDLGRPPTKREYDERGITSAMTLTRRFGSFNEALEEAGLETRPPGGPRGERVSNEDILDDIIAGREALGIWPRVADYEDDGTYSAKLVIDRFGSWENAIDAAKERAGEDNPGDDEPDAANIGGDPLGEDMDVASEIGRRQQEAVERFLAAAKGNQPAEDIVDRAVQSMAVDNLAARAAQALRRQGFDSVSPKDVGSMGAVDFVISAPGPGFETRELHPSSLIVNSDAEFESYVLRFPAADVTVHTAREVSNALGLARETERAESTQHMERSTETVLPHIDSSEDADLPDDPTEMAALLGRLRDIFFEELE